MFPLKLRRTGRCAKEFNVVRDEDRTGIVVVVEFEQFFPLTLYTETHHSWFTEFLDRDADGVWLLITPNTNNLYFYIMYIFVYKFKPLRCHPEALKIYKNWNYNFNINTFATSYLNTQGLNNSCLKSPASTLVDLTFQSRALRSFSLNKLRNLSL